MEDIKGRALQLLLENADEKTRLSSLNFFKETVRVHGVKSAAVTKIAGQLFSRVKQRSKEEIFALCEELWRSGYLEETGIACNWSYAIRKQYRPEDFKVFEKWVETYVHNWAACDTLCNHSVGTLVEMYPELVQPLKGWALSGNRWKRRACAVTLIVPARKGLFLNDVFEIAQTLLLDADDLVRKGYGWMLKAASEAHQNEVFAFVMARKTVMPRTALRYAIEKMPKELRAKAMEK